MHSPYLHSEIFHGDQRQNRIFRQKYVRTTTYIHIVLASPWISIVEHHIVAPEISHGVAAVNAEGSELRLPDVDDVIGRRHQHVADLTVNPSRWCMAPKKQLMSFRG